MQSISPQFEPAMLTSRLTLPAHSKVTMLESRVKLKSPAVNEFITATEAIDTVKDSVNGISCSLLPIGRLVTVHSSAPTSTANAA